MTINVVVKHVIYDTVGVVVKHVIYDTDILGAEWLNELGSWII
jgi:hypothetical protein